MLSFCLFDSVETRETRPALAAFRYRQRIHTLLNTYPFNYQAGIRKGNYTTTAIGSINSVIRQVLKKQAIMTRVDSVNKIV